MDGFHTPVNATRRRGPRSGTARHLHDRTPDPDHDHDDDGDHDQAAAAGPRPLAGHPGSASRHARRLQLRNAGFRGAAVPTRKVTPKSLSSSPNWAGVRSGSDAENVSPSGGRAGSVRVAKRRSSGILQEIGQTTLTRPKATRARVSLGQLYASDAAAGAGAGDDDHPFAHSPSSPPFAKPAIRVRSAKTRARVAGKRRSVSGETRMYIDHLEAELAAAQTQLQDLTSPSAASEQSSKLRALNAETKRLQDEVAEWEATYEQRVQEEVEKHRAIEAGLRSQIRRLEQNAVTVGDRLEELKLQLESANQNAEAVETANVNLEKRLEIMSDLLAASPAKIDLRAGTPGIRKHRRPRSMLPRFPTASSLVVSPSRESPAQPISPMLSSVDTNSSTSNSVEHARLSLDTTLTFSPSATASDSESIFSAAPVDSDSMTSYEHHDAHPNLHMWTTHSAKGRPTRRMRRFVAGSVGPKPLILPSTSHCEQIPASAPPLDNGDMAATFPFPPVGRLAQGRTSPSPVRRRHRASTTEDEAALAGLVPSSFLELASSANVCEDRTLNLPRALPAPSRATTRNYSPPGPATGRNLMDELCATGDEQLTGGEAHGRAPRIPEDGEDEPEDVALIYDQPADKGAGFRNMSGPNRLLITPVPSGSIGLRPHLGGAPGPIGPGSSIWDRLRVLFGDFWRSPVALARHLIQTAQLRMRIPAPLMNVQWWLVGMLLGPMARQRMLSAPSYCGSVDVEQGCVSQPALESSDDEIDGLAYGRGGASMSASPGSGHQAQGTTSGRRKKRPSHKKPCSHHHCHRHHHGGHDEKLFMKHSPWVWLKFSITLAFAVGVAFKDGPGSLLNNTVHGCEPRQNEKGESEKQEV